MNKKTVFYTSPPSSPSSSSSSSSASSSSSSSSVKGSSTSTPFHSTLQHSDPNNKSPSKNFVFSPFSSRSSPYPPCQPIESKSNFSTSRPPVFGISARDRLLQVEMCTIYLILYNFLIWFYLFISLNLSRKL